MLALIFFFFLRLLKGPLILLIIAYLNHLLLFCIFSLYGVVSHLKKLQNHAARVIFRKSVRDHAMPLLMDLHWLPITARIDYKIALIVL